MLETPVRSFSDFSLKTYSISSGTLKHIRYMKGQTGPYSCQDLTLKLPITTTVICFVTCLWFKKSFLQYGPRSDSSSRSSLMSDQGPYCLLVCKNRFENFARIFSRQHKQTTFSGFLGILRVTSKLLSQSKYPIYPKYTGILTPDHLILKSK